MKQMYPCQHTRKNPGHIHSCRPFVQCIKNKVVYYKITLSDGSCFLNSKNHERLTTEQVTAGSQKQPVISYLLMKQYR